MPSYAVRTPQQTYPAVVERGILARTGAYIPEKVSRIFVVTTEDVWRYHCARLADGLAGRSHEILFYPGGEERKRLSEVEALAEQMVRRGGDRSSLVIGFGGGIVTDVGGFAASIFMRGIPVLQIPTTLLAQVDAALGGKTGVNLAEGKNLLGTFHQPLAVLIDPDVLATLPEREYRAGLFEILKTGIISRPNLFSLLMDKRDAVLARDPGVLLSIISETVAMKADVVSRDERESGIRQILNLGHTVGHALETETEYARYLHGEAVGFGMRVATLLAEKTGRLPAAVSGEILSALDAYGPIPELKGITATALVSRLYSDKKTIKGILHFVLPVKIGEVELVSGLDEAVILSAIEDALA